MKLRYRIIMFIFGIYLSSWSLFFLTVYSSILKTEISFKEYILFLLSKYETYTLIIGFILALFSIIKKELTK